MNNKYISIKEACELFKKSLSTIRRVVKEIPSNKIKFEELPTGKQKIFIEREYLNDYFNVKGSSNSQVNDSSNSQVNDSSEQLLIKTFESIIKTLNNELESKNKQIDALIERQRESNILIDIFSKKIALETKENNDTRRKWWQRKK